MRNLYRHIFRDRRRLSFTALMLALSLTLGWNTASTDLPIARDVGTVLFLLVVAGGVAIAAPRLRFAVEVAAVSNFVFVGLGHLLPTSNFNLANPHLNPASAVLLYLFVIVVMHTALNGRWSDRFTPIRRRTVARATSTLSAKDLWYGLVPTPGHLDEIPDADVVSIDYADPSRRVIRLLNWRPPGRSSELLLHVDEIDAPHFVRLRIERVDPERGNSFEGTTSFRITDQGARRRVEICHVADALPIRRHARGWLDDTLGRWLDLRLSRVEETTRALCHSAGGVRIKCPEKISSADYFNSVYAQAKPHKGPDRRRTPLPHWIASLPRTER